MKPVEAEASLEKLLPLDLDRIHKLLREKYFPKLSACPVRFADQFKHRGCLAFWRAKDGITIYRHRAIKTGRDLVETLLHEMTHQWLHEIGERPDHSPLFKVKLDQVLKLEFPDHVFKVGAKKKPVRAKAQLSLGV